MRKVLIPVFLLLVVPTTVLRAQFIHELQVSRHLPRPPRPVPLRPVVIEKHVIRVDVRDGLARTTVRQTFRNPNQVILEGTYFFPLPDGAALQDFSMSMGGKMVKGEVLEKEKATAIYEGIVRQRRDPALLEYVGRRLFRARVFPIPAGGTTEIELSYSESLRRDGNMLEYRHPFRTRGVTPRPIGQAVLDMRIHSSTPLRTVYSPSHEVQVVKKGDHEARVSFEHRNDPGDADIVVVYGLSRKPVGAMLFTHAESPSDGHFLLLLAPAEEWKEEIVEKDVVFVVDTSGSMAGPKIEQTRRALSYCVQSLRAGDRFEIIRFATEARPLFGGLEEVGKDSIARAMTCIKAIEARGGTNIEEALVKALTLDRKESRPLMVIFMTDGEPTIGVTRPEEILARVKRAGKALTRLFVFGVGDDLNAELLDALAEENHGARDYVGDDESIELKISSFFQKVSSPVLSDLSLQVEGVGVSETYPKNLPDLFKGSQVLVTGAFHGSGPAQVLLRGQVNGRPREFRFEVEFKPGSQKTAFVSRLWAVRKVGYLMDQIRLHGENPEVRDEIVRLGKKYGIVTPYTSYLVVEDSVAAVPRRRTRIRSPRLSGGLVPPTGGGERRDLGSARRNAARGGEPPAEELEADEVLRLGHRPSRSDRDETKVGGRLVAPGETVQTPLDAPLKERKRKAFDKLLEGYFQGAVSVSKQVKGLRESGLAGVAGSSLLVRRIGDRTFYHRKGFFIEAPILDLKAGAIQKRLVRMEAFSSAYFDLLKKRPDLASILAMGERLLFLDGERIVQVLPPGTLEKTPAVDPPGKERKK